MRSNRVIAFEQGRGERKRARRLCILYNCCCYRNDRNGWSYIVASSDSLPYIYTSTRLYSASLLDSVLVSFMVHGYIYRSRWGLSRLLGNIAILINVSFQQGFVNFSHLLRVRGGCLAVIYIYIYFRKFIAGSPSTELITSYGITPIMRKVSRV